VVRSNLDADAKCTKAIGAEATFCCRSLYLVNHPFSDFLVINSFVALASCKLRKPLSCGCYGTQNMALRPTQWLSQRGYRGHCKTPSQMFTDYETYPVRRTV